jgi:RNA polymerase sigma factor (sigma-70 family)
MTGKNDDAASFREDSFLDGLVPQVAERLAEQHAGSFDAEAGLARFQIWLDAHTKEPAASAKGRRSAGAPVNDDLHPRPRAKAPATSAATDIAGLVRGAAAGDRRAWERLVAQYARLIWSITAEFKLAESDAADVAQTTWLRLLEHIDRIEDPDRIGSWLAATARNECLRNLAARKRVVLARDEEVLSGVVASGPEVDERILADERDQVVRDALSRLPRRWQRLLELLMADPPVSYAEISDELGLPVGSIGPARGRCLARLRSVLQASEAGADGRTVSALCDSESHRDWEVAGELVSGRCG